MKREEVKVLDLKAIGLVRRVDDLGRVVIPKEVRTMIDVNAGDAMEIFVTKDKQVVLRKYVSAIEK
jgi:AbrB family transcriptional regulator (stage V sporulation protein T)